MPEGYRRLVFDHFHGLGHPGVRATRRLISSRFIWPGLAGEVARWARECPQCQRAKIHHHTHPSPAPIDIPPRRFAHVHLDLVGPLPLSQGCTHLLTMVDRTTRWLEAVPVSSLSAADCAAVFCSAWVARFGAPEHLTTDRGAQFTSALWAALLSLLQIKPIRTTAFHPQSNGMVERFHRRLKAVLVARCAAADWVAHLPWTLLSLRTTPHEKSGLSPAEAVYGSALTLPAQFPIVPDGDGGEFSALVDRCLAGVTSAPPSTLARAPVIPPELRDTPMVFVRAPPSRPPLSPPYVGPYKVLRRSPHTFLLQLGDRQDHVSTHRLKPAQLPPSSPPAEPPRRGRPRKRSFTPPTPPRARTPPAVHFAWPPTRPVRLRRPPAKFSDFFVELKILGGAM